MVKLNAGRINVVSGQPVIEGAAMRLKLQNKIVKERQLQDYVVVPSQMLLNGIAGADGSVCQFVTMSTLR